MKENNKVLNAGLNIQLVSFSLPNIIVDGKEKIQISITTFPEKYRYHYNIKYKKLKCFDHSFPINITNQTKTILMVFKKKSNSPDEPIIACITIHSNQIPNIPQNINDTKDNLSSRFKILNVYEPIKKNKTEKEDTHKYKFTESFAPLIQKVDGEMEFLIKLVNPYIIKKINSSKNNKNEKGYLYKVKNA